MSTFYAKNGNKYVPVEFKQIVTKDWNDKVIVVRIGTEENPAELSEVEETMECLNDSDALEKLENTSFLVTLYEMDFQTLGSVKEVADQCVAVRVTGGDDLTKLGKLQKQAKEQLRGKAKKVAVLPAPLTVNEYKQVMDIKRRCDTRRTRRGR
jgi:hypothetical protein